MVKANEQFRHGVEIIDAANILPGNGLLPAVISRIKMAIHTAVRTGSSGILFLAVYGTRGMSDEVLRLLIQGEIVNTAREVCRTEKDKPDPIIVQVTILPSGVASAMSLHVLLQKTKVDVKLPESHPMRTRLAEAPRNTATTMMGMPIIGGGDRTTVMVNPWYEVPEEPTESDEFEIDLADILDEDHAS